MPNVVDIIQSIQVPQLIKDTFICKGKPVLDKRGRPIHYTGGFAVAFPFVVNGEKWAFRCWSADIGNVENRLRTLSKELSNQNLPYFCDFTYEAEGITINGETFPTTRMRWIDGQTIKDYLCNNKDDSNKIKQLANNFLTMCNELHKRKIAHGDLQHGNILVDDIGSLFLIDYDSVFLPALKGVDDIISGLADYQHPKRKDNKHASEKLDYFSELIIYLSILAIADAPSLVDKYKVENADRLLFAKEDFDDITKSQIYKDIQSLGKQFQELLDVLEEYLKCNSIDDLLPFDTFLLDKRIRFSTTATKAVRDKQAVVVNWLVPFDANVELLEKLSGQKWDVDSKGQKSMTLSDDATFELEVIFSDGKIFRKEISIRVFDECEIDFSADKYYIFPTIPVTLSWNVKNAKTVWLDKEEVEAKGSKVIEPEKAVSVVLSAEDEFGVKEKRIDIGMLPIPQVKALLVPTPNIVSNMSITVKQPRFRTDVKFPVIDIDWIKAEVPRVKSLTELGLFRNLSPSLPSRRFSLWRTIKRVYNHIIRK